MLYKGNSGVVTVYQFIAPPPLMRRGVDGFSPSSWEPQEEGMMSTAASFSLSKKPRFIESRKKLILQKVMVTSLLTL
jgi:hypothetical protein